MATAKKNQTTKTETRTVEVIVKTDDGVTLTLTQDEAEALIFILRRVGGDPKTTPRGHVQEINDALFYAGISEPDEYKEEHLLNKQHTSIIFDS